MKIKNKILLAQTPLGVILILIGFFFIFSLNNLGLNTHDILTSNYRSVSALENMRIALNGIEWVVKRHSAKILSNKLYKDRIESYKNDFARNLKIQLSNITISGEPEETKNLEEIWSTLSQKISNQNVSTTNINNISNELVILKQKLDLLIQINQDDSFFKSQNIIDMINSFINLTFAFSFAGFLIGVLITIYITNKILQPLEMLNKSVKSISNGEIGLKVNVEGNDEISELASEFNSMIRSLEEYRSSSSGKIIKAKIFLQAALDTIPDPMLIMSRSYEIENFNQKAKEVFNLNSEKEQTLQQVISKDIFEDLSIKIRKAFVTDIKPTSLKPIFLKIDNDKYIEYFPIIHPIEQTGLGVNSVCLILRNITDVDLAGYIKAENIISSMHELLIPLESTQIGLHIALEQKIGELNNEQLRIFGIAQKSCLDLRRMISNVIDNNFNYEKQNNATTKSSNLDQILKSILNDFELTIESKNLNLETDISHIFGTVNVNPNDIASIIKSLCFAIFEFSKTKSNINIELKEKKKVIQIHFRSSSIDLSISEISKILDENYKNRNKSQQAIHNANLLLKKVNGTLELLQEDDKGITKFVAILKKS